jgi:hypothetical protein
MNSRAYKYLFLIPLLIAFVLAAPKAASADDDDDPPSRVARLSHTSGQVSFNPAGTDDWVSAVLNRPITTGDKLWTDENSRAELQIGSASVRLDGMTGFSFLNLDDRIMQIRLTEGTINLRVRRLESDESIEVDTPNLAFSALRPGNYRINVSQEGDTTVINVPEGEGEVTGGGSAYTLHPGDQGIFTGTDQLNPDVEPLPGDDDFDRWCTQRDLREDHAVARKYVSDDVIGYEDLDDYGGWRPIPEYGTVWFPHASVIGWAPYRYGHWAWISPWGWTWVDDAPWGFAPFHYGRWVNYGGAWGWVPCPPRTVAVAYVRPVYAPALVAWVGGPHFAAGVAFGGGIGVGVNVGWFPLGPREVFVPSYHVSRVYVNRVNISNTTVNQTVINNYYNTTVVNKTTVNNVTYVNQNVRGAVTATSGQAFTSSQSVSRNIVRVNEREISSAPVAVRAPSVVPPREAVLGGAAVTRYQPPARLQSRAVVAKTAPPPAPISFAQRQEAIRQNQGQPISIAQSRQLAQQQQRSTSIAAVHVAPPARTVTNVPMGNRNQQPGAPSNMNRPANANANPNVNSNVNRPPNNNPPANINTNANTNANLNPNANRPANNNPPVNTNTNVNANPNANPNGYRDRPPTSRPNQTYNPQLEQKHQEEIQQLQQKQDQQYQKFQQKQNQEQQKLEQRNVDAQKQQQEQQKEQQKLQQMEDHHSQQRQQLQQKQEQEHVHAQQNAPKQERPPKTDDKPPHH